MKNRTNRRTAEGNPEAVLEAHTISLRGLLKDATKSYESIKRNPEDSYQSDNDVYEDYMGDIVSSHYGWKQGWYVNDAMNLGLDVGETDDDFEADSWDDIDREMYKLSDAATKYINANGIPGSVYFGFLEADGSYGVFYAIGADELELEDDDEDFVPEPHSASTRRRKASDGQYEAVIENTSQGPGKFEAEGAVGEWAYDKVVEGWGETIGDEFFGVYTVVTLDKPVLVNERDGTSWTFMGFSVYEDDNGFAYMEYYDTVAEAEAMATKLESDYQEDLEDRPEEAW